MADGTPSHPCPRPLVELRSLRKSYGNRLALADLTLTLERCEVVGVIGADGAGKTTLLRSLAGLLEIEAEVAQVLGYDLRADVTELKSHVGYVPQAFSLQRDLSIIENLRFTARLHRLDTQEFEERSKILLRRTDLTPFADRAAGMLSGGMKQKLAIANALLIRPQLLLLDEPTAGVDVTARGEIWDLLRAAAGESLILVSTSYLDETSACDRLLYLDSGKLVAAGAPRELQHRVPVELYRVWGTDPIRSAEGARRLNYVASTRSAVGHVRVEVHRQQSPGRARVKQDLQAQPENRGAFVECADTDMESTLLFLSRGIRSEESRDV